MRYLTIKFLVAVFTFILGITVASIWVVNRFQSNGEGKPSPQETSAPTTAEPVLSPTPNSPIRSVDFANFTYPYADDHKESFTLRNGEEPETRNQKGLIVREGFSLGRIKYADVTGDGQEEAFVSIGMLTGGSAMPNYIYIYTLYNQRPKLLWSFATGDRADGGLRRVIAENGELIVELYGKGKIVGSDLFVDDGMVVGDCCPTHFTRARYRWNGKRFILKGEPEVLPNPEGHGSPIE